ncbi:aspartate kinase [candidate division KSB1 bacterium]|nr:aspartate kinase [candidate division KSB1 bacterium]
MLTVEKIGGTSMSKFGNVLQNIILTDGKKVRITNRILVVSAYGGVTDLLLENKKTGAPGIYARFTDQVDYEKSLDGLLDNLFQINDSFLKIGLDLKEADAFIKDRITQTKNVLASMSEVLASGYVAKSNILLATREILASIGEAHSSFNSVNILNNNDIPAKLIDLSGFHDSEFLTIDERIHKAFKDVDLSKQMIVATGYTKGTEGIMREFDRGYSEVTFSKVAVEVKADEAIIQKEYHLSSADPNIVGVENAVPVGHTNYDVADQLADIGMEAIHPKASKPLEQLGINLRIKNTFEPDHPGTLISKNYMGPESRVEIIAGAEDVSVIEIHDSSMVGEVGFDLHMMEVFHKHRISYILKTTNANSISLVIWDRLLSEALLTDLKSKYQEVQTKPVAVISIIGSNIAKPGVLAHAARVLAENQINVECVSQSMRQVNMQFVITRDHFKDAIKALNMELCVNNSNF